MKTNFVFLSLALLLFACTHRESRLKSSGPILHTDPHRQEIIRYLALGDSYTIGEAVEEGRRWPVQLADSLANSGFSMDEVEIIAQTGWTTGELLEAINTQDPQGPYHLVTLLIGVNNQYRGLDTSEYRQEFRVLLQMAIAFAGGDAAKVIVVSVPDYGVTPFAKDKDPEKIAREIDAFNAIKRDEAVEAGVHYVDVTNISRHAETEPALIAEDGLHPSDMMYEKWVKKIHPVALEILENQQNQDR